MVERLDQWQRPEAERALERAYAASAKRYFDEVRRVRLFERRWGGPPDDDKCDALSGEVDGHRSAWVAGCPEMAELQAIVSGIESAMQRAGVPPAVVARLRLELVTASGAVRRCENAMLKRQVRHMAMVGAWARKRRWGGSLGS